MRIEWVAYGTDQSGSATLNQWSTYSSTDRYPAVASTWYDTDNATYEIRSSIRSWRHTDHVRAP